MWVELICGLIIFRLLKRFFYDDDDTADILDADTFSSDATALFTVAHRLEKLYGGKAYVGLQIPDADAATRQTIGMVLVTKREAVIVSVKNVSGMIPIDSKDGAWEDKGRRGEGRGGVKRECGGFKIVFSCSADGFENVHFGHILFHQ